MYRQYVYACVNKRCSHKGDEIRNKISPAEARASHGRSFSCSKCGHVMFLRRVVLDNQPRTGGVQS